MKEITPFKDVKEALATLDNGGRFYNLLTKANDGNISLAELNKVAGAFTDKQQMVLYFSMSIYELERQEQIQSALSDNLKKAYKKYFPQTLLPSEAKTKGVLSSNAIITGIPKKIESKNELNGFVMIPIVAGNVTTFTMIPIFDQYDVYELRDDITSNTFLIAHSRGSISLPQKKLRVGGILKELNLKEGNKEIPEKYLEALFFTALA